MAASSPRGDIFDEYEFVEREPNAENSASLDMHDDDTDSLGVVSLDDSNSEGCVTPSAAASAVIAALEDIGPFDQIQEIIQQAVASVHSASAAAAQNDTAAPIQDPVELDATVNATSALQEDAAVNDTKITEKTREPATSVPTAVKPTHIAEAAVACGCTATHAVLLLVLGACAAAVTAVLLGSVGLLPQPNTDYTPQVASVAIPHVVGTSVTFYNMTALIPARYGRFAAKVRQSLAPDPLPQAMPARVVSKPGPPSAETAAAAPVNATATVPAAAVNMLLACPKEWLCRYSQPKLTYTAAGVTTRSCRAAQQSLSTDKQQRRHPTAAALLHQLPPPSILAAPALSAAAGHSVPAFAANITLCISAAPRQPSPLAPPRPAAAAATAWPAAAAVNLMLACPKEWVCVLTNNTRAPAGALPSHKTRQSTAKPGLPKADSKHQRLANSSAAIAAAPTACQAEASLNSTTALQYQTLSPLQRLCSYLCACPSQKQQQTAGSAHKSSSSKQQTAQLMLPSAVEGSKQTLYQNASCILHAVLDLACRSSSESDAKHGLLHNVTTRSAVNRHSLQDRLPSACRAAAAVLLQTVRAAKLVPPLYRPAPPCLMIPPRGRQHGRANMKLQSQSLTTAGTAVRSNVTTSKQSSQGQKGSQSVLGSILAKAALLSSSLGLPMLPPLVYPLFGVVNATNSSSSRGTCTSGGAAPEPVAAAAAAGLTLPMLPPVKGYKAVSGGLTLPMLPPTSCASCGKQLQLVQTGSSLRNVILTSPSVQPTCPVVSGTACTAPEVQYRQYRLQYSRYQPEQQQREHQGATISSNGSSGGLLLVHMLPPVAAAGNEASSTDSTANSMDGTVRVSRHQVGLSQHDCTAKPAAAAAAAQNNNSSASSNETDSTGAFASGSWVTTWVSFPMLLPSKDMPFNSKQQPGALMGLTSKPSVTPQHKMLAGHVAATVDRRVLPVTANVRHLSLAAPAPSPVAAAAANSAILQPGSTATNTQSVKQPVLAGIPARPLQGWLQAIHHEAAAALRPAEQMMQLLSTASARSLQCTTVHAANEQPKRYSTFGAKTATGEGSGRRTAENAAYQTNNAAHAASKELFDSVIQLEHATWCATTVATGAPTAPGNRCFVTADVATVKCAAKLQETVQSLCSHVATAHRDLQHKLAAAVVKQQDYSTPFRISIAVEHSATPAMMAAAVTVKVQNQGPAPLSAAAKPSTDAIPLGPVGGFELLVSRTNAARKLEDPTVPLRQQLKATQQHPLHAGNTGMLAAPPKLPPARSAAAFAAGSGGRTPSVLNAGWDETSAWAVAKVSARLAKAEARLQKACSSIKSI